MSDQKKNVEKKIIVDEDWKEQARKEKEILAAKEKAEKEQAQAKKPRQPLPPGDFTTLVSTLATQALFALGALAPADEKNEKKEPDLEMAKYNIDILETLETKTKGNLTEQEEKLLSSTLHQLRMVYVKLAG